MSKNKSSRAEKIKLREETAKKAKQKKILTLCGCILAAAAVIAILAIYAVTRDGEAVNEFGSRHVHTANCRH
jgi:hypothetical protein